MGAEEAGVPEPIEPLQTALLEWYHEHARPFPWRETTDPYRILVCEVMSQQTQLDRIVEPWRAFLSRWPTIADLATADRAAVIEFWSSHRLGYNNRAKWLHQAAVDVVDVYEGTIPSDPAALQELPGVGPYTANAVASFAFNGGAAVVDTNVKRVLYRLCSVPESAEPPYETIANRLLPEGASRPWNNAMMELGATVCRKQPRCDEAECPWRRWCAAYREGDFTTPDVPKQPPFEGSRRQYRGRIVRALGTQEQLHIDELGPRIRVDYVPDGEPGREWLRNLLEELQADGLVERVADEPWVFQLQS